MTMRLLFIFLAAIFCSSIFAQKPDSLRVAEPDSVSPASFFPIKRDSLFQTDIGKSDTTVMKASKHGLMWKVFSKKYPNPRTAALLSFVLPGAGQAYNKKWWKIPIAWAALGGIGYFTFDTQNTYHKLRDNYKLLVDGDPNTNPTESPYNTFDAQRTKSYRDTFRGYTEKWYLALGVTYLLTVTDAFVDAQLANFDVSDDLSLRLKPSFEATSGMPAFGLGVSFNFTSSPVKTPHSFINPMISQP